MHFPDDPRSTVQVLNRDREALKKHGHGIPLLWLIHALIQAYLDNPEIVDPYLPKVGYCRPTSYIKKVPGRAA